MSTVNSFGARTALAFGGRTVQTYSLPALERTGFSGIARLPYSMKILLENLLRHEDGRFVKAADVEALARWDLASTVQKEISFAPARVLLQRCATGSSGSAAIRTKSIRCSRSNSSSIIRCRWITSASPTPSS
jgi:aconitase A